MTDYLKLKMIIVNYFYNYKAYELQEVCKRYGVECDKTLNPMHSKREYVKSGLSNKTTGQLKNIAKQIISEECDVEFVKTVEPFLNDDFFEITMMTRRVLLDWITARPDLEGNSTNICEFVSMTWDLDSIKIPIFTGETCTAKEYIIQHMIRNDDIGYEECFENILDFMYIPDRQLFQFLETLVNPPVRPGGSQIEYVTTINSIIGINGYRLVSERNIAGISIYELKQFSSSGIPGEVHNIIFGAYDGKPDIVIDDALVNKLRVIGDENKCLFYDAPITSAGLSWRDLLIWWNNGNENIDMETKKNLVQRLKKSLDSKPEVLFLRTYYNHLHKTNNIDLPALIPQVYCHFDPKSAKMRNGQVYVLQRMDFLMLFPNGVRIVIEIDGKQHYSENDVASPAKYAEMVENDRELKLYGYDVYRFGGYEFLETERIKNKIEIFIEKLFAKYDVHK